MFQDFPSENSHFGFSYIITNAYSLTFLSASLSDYIRTVWSQSVTLKTLNWAHGLKPSEFSTSAFSRPLLSGRLFSPTIVLTQSV
jgi:hypothetical protein